MRASPIPSSRQTAEAVSLETTSRRSRKLDQSVNFLSTKESLESHAQRITDEFDVVGRRSEGFGSPLQKTRVQRVLD